MIENRKLPTKLRRIVEQELESTELIRWIEQPIPRFFTRSTVGASLALVIPIIVFSFAGWIWYNQAKDMGESLLDFTYVIGMIVFFIGAIIPLLLIFLIPFYNWIELRQTVYLITDKRALILVSRWSTTVTYFIPYELRVISRQEHKDGSGDVIVYIHKSKDYDGDVHTQEMGFKQVRNPKALQKILLQLNSN
jgi:hypothetical protein